MTDFNQKTHDTDVGSHGGQSRQMMEVFENQEFVVRSGCYRRQARPSSVQAMWRKRWGM